MTRRGLRPAAISGLAALLLTAALPAPRAGAAATLANGGFEAGGTGTAAPAGWSTAGDASADYTEAGGHTGGFRLTHWARSPYRVETRQRLTGLADGPYTLTAWIRSSGGQNAATLSLRDCGSPTQGTDLQPTFNGQWIRLVASVDVRGGACTVSLASDAHAKEWINVDDVTLTPGSTGLTVRGVDVSSLPKNEDHGALYRRADGSPGDALDILRGAGADYARLKVWMDPADGYNDKAHVLAMARRIKAQGMKLLVDFHYSDAWADPGKQNKPAAWASYGYEQLRTAVHDHTYDVLSALKAQGTTADMVQIGNEINGGLLWPDGSWEHWPQLAGLLTAGSDAAKEVSASTRVALHLAEGGDNGGTRWWFDQAVAYDVPFDVIALSFYGYWHGVLSDLQANMDDVAARYGRDVLVAETAYAFRLDSDDPLENIIDRRDELVASYPATPAGQSAWLRDVMNVVEAVPGGRGLGVVYWEPAWTAVAGSGWDPADPASGNAWENQALFGYDDRALPAMDRFRHR
ncbi:glycosyl hydrolase 53 family protein [Streptomyces sp. NPDC051940]|uniref:glycosyl hydrolase 53 family protein n=1 Tax=Streptomyces sp. NPDC051940 TaxID=3155675 RepID=UPI00342CF717